MKQNSETKKKNPSNKRLPLEEALKVLKEAKANLKSEYYSASKTIEVECKDCGYQWPTTVTALRTSSCKPCGYLRNSQSRRLPDKEISKRLDAVDIDYIGGYENANKPLIVRHRKCGHTTDNQKLHVLTRGFGCSKCFHVQDEEYHAYASKFGGKVIDIASSSDKKSRWYCQDCEKEFQRSLSVMKTTQTFCSTCSKRLSERICQAVFEAVFDTYFEKYKIPDLRGLKGGMLEFDLFNSDLKVAVEHHGSHHFKPRYRNEPKERLKTQIAHDQLKRDYCLKNKIALFEIPELFSMTPLTELSNVIQKQAIELEIKLPDNFEEIIAKIEPAGISSTDKAQFQNLLSVAQKDGYELLEKKFRGSHAIHNFRCPNGHPFPQKAYSFLQGIRCNRCYEMSTYQPVILSNGEMYETGNKAGESIGVDSGSIWSAINKRHRVKDLTVVKITKDEYDRAIQEPKFKNLLKEKAQLVDYDLRDSKNPVITSDGRIFESQMSASKVLANNNTAVGQALTRSNGTVNKVGVKNITKDEYQQCIKNKKFLDKRVKELWPLGVESKGTKKMRLILSDGRIFSSQTELSKTLKLNSASSISLAIKRNGKYAKIKGFGVKKISNKLYLELNEGLRDSKEVIKELWPNGIKKPDQTVKQFVQMTDIYMTQ